MIDLLAYRNRVALEEKLLECNDKYLYEEELPEEIIELLDHFSELNLKKSSEYNIKCFFELLDELIGCIDILKKDSDKNDESC